MCAFRSMTRSAAAITKLMAIHVLPNVPALCNILKGSARKNYRKTNLKAEIFYHLFYFTGRIDLSK